MDQTLYICYQSGTDASILAIVDTEELAKEICCFTDDRYTQMILNKDYGRIEEETSEEAVYNIGGKFILGFSEASKEFEKCGQFVFNKDD